MEFKEYFLKDICYFQEGYVNPKQTISDYFDGEVKWLRANDLQNNYVYNTSRTLTKAGFESAGKSAKLFKPNTIAISKSGTIGRLGILKDYMCGNRAVINIECNNDIIDIKYLYYFLLFNRPYIESLAQGSVQKNLYVFILEKVKIKLPNKDIQKKIIKILNDIDNKIELNNKINDNLHKLSDELYKGWFIDYNYPNFDGKLKESNLGLIPENWRIERLDNIAECQNGYAFYKDGYDDDGLMVIDLGNINLNSTFIYTNADKHIKPDRVEKDKFEKYKVYKNDLIMVMTDRKATMELLGKTGKIYEDNEFLLNQRMYRIRSEINTNYLYTALNNDLILNKLKSKALGSVQKYVNTGHINELEILIGTDEIMDKFSKMVDPIYAEIENRTIENTRLEKLRDTLLPKLMNGEIDLDKIEI